MISALKPETGVQFGKQSQPETNTQARGVTATTANLIAPGSSSKKGIRRVNPKRGLSILLMLVGLFLLGLLHPTGMFPGKQETTVSPLPSQLSSGITLETRLAQYIAKQYRVSLQGAVRVVEAARKAAHTTGVPVSLVLAVAAVESSFNPKGVSSMGALGLMQVMPVLHRDVLPEGKELDVESNVTAGAYILSGYLSRDGDDIVNALQRYNGNRHDSQARYAHKVLSKMVEFEAAGAGVRQRLTSS